MRFRFLFVALVLSLSFVGCGPSEDKIKDIEAAEQLRLQKEDSLAFKVGVLPTLDCLPVFVAKEEGLFDSLGVDIRLREVGSQIDCDAALMKGKLQCGFTDIVRTERMKNTGVKVEYLSSTNAYWQLVSNRLSRIKNLRQLKEKKIAMSRYSATDMLTHYAVDSAKLKQDDVFRIQVNDARVRLGMLVNNELDAMLFTEPQATTARLYKHPLLLDSRNIGVSLGAIVISGDFNDKLRAKQLKVFVDAYNKACDRINANGIKHYASLIIKYCNSDDNTINAIPELRYTHISKPQSDDIETARKWLKAN